MVIKKFTAGTLPEALTKVKRDFGDEAVILKTRFDNKGATGQESKIVEVTAAIDNNSVKTASFKPRPVSSSEIPAGQAGKRINRIKSDSAIAVEDIVENEAKSIKIVKKPVNRVEEIEKGPGNDNGSAVKNRLENLEKKPLPSEILGEIKEELSQLRSELNKLFDGEISREDNRSLGDHLIDEIRRGLSHLQKQNTETIFAQPKTSIIEYIRSLVGMHVPEEIAQELVRKIPQNIINSGKIEIGWNSLTEIMSELLGPGEPIKMAGSGPTVVMLVGPTGSGKSSAAARLAFKYSLEENQIVSLVTTDTFRADSKEQLASLANVIGCSFASVSSPQELAVLMKTFKEGLVVIDTSGVSGPQDREDLAAMVNAASPHEVHLTVPADLSAADLADFIRDNSGIGVDRLMVTKLDQTIYRGGIIGAAVKLGLRFSFESSSRELPGKFGLFNPVAFVSSVNSVRERILSVQE